MDREEAKKRTVKGIRIIANNTYKVGIVIVNILGNSIRRIGVAIHDEWSRIKEERRLHKEAMVKMRMQRIKKNNEELTNEEARYLAKKQLKKERWEELFPKQDSVGNKDKKDPSDGEDYDFKAGPFTFHKDKQNTFLGMPIANSGPSENDDEIDYEEEAKWFDRFEDREWKRERRDMQREKHDDAIRRERK